MLTQDLVENWLNESNSVKLSNNVKFQWGKKHIINYLLFILSVRPREGGVAVIHPSVCLDCVNVVLFL